nr:heavy metal translocating P-type ATPase metal-binding domain-containing protein [Cyclobacteriaceae bacterium]
MEVLEKEQVACYHCGQACEETHNKIDDKLFCCQGCRTVYEILNENNLCDYYSYQQNPGVNLRYVSEETYAYLDEATIRKKLLTFDSDTFARVEFFIPAIHCISCIWLLENLHKLNPGVLKSEVNFARKRATIDFNPATTSLGAVARLIASLGYAPQINLSEAKKEDVASSKALIMKLAVAGFAFGNIMLLSFPEYLGLEGTETELKTLFSYLNIALAIPATFYSGWDYFKNAFQSFKQRQINIDVPIAVGLAALFLRSTYDILSNTGAGYLDSLAGLVFFLLIGRWFQSKTYESLAFDRDFRSYFPLAVQKKELEDWKPVVIYELEQGDTIRIRNWEVVPADSLLLDEEAYFDYSFVTGESKPVSVKAGGLVYAGGRLIGKPVTMVVEKKTSQSHLTSLWNKEVFQKPEESKYKKIIDAAARRFTWVVLVIALATGIFWYMHDQSQMWLVLTAVLMVACPCALALAAPFTYGNMLRVFGRHGFYLKNADVIERLAKIDAVVFDKTGTVTKGASRIEFIGALDDHEFGYVKSLTSSSSHPLSNLITKSIQLNSSTPVIDFFEKPGRGIEGKLEGQWVKVGSAEYVQFEGTLTDLASKVFVSINDQVRGYFKVETSLREGIEQLMQSLNQKEVALLSGDSDADKEKMKSIFPASAGLHFNQSPHDKLDFISKLQHDNKKVMMLGDGLNDSGALKQSDVGIAITDDTGVFTPSCDGILEGGKLSELNKFISLAKSATLILKTGFGISFFYNVIALSFAVSGHLTPLVAAI